MTSTETDALHAGYAAHMLDGLLDQPAYQVTASSGVVHRVPCVRNTTRRPLPWPDFKDATDRPCTHCMPDGLPGPESEGASMRNAIHAIRKIAAKSIRRPETMAALIVIADEASSRLPKRGSQHG
jgi:hypothetical protein